MRGRASVRPLLKRGAVAFVAAAVVVPALAAVPVGAAQTVLQGTVVTGTVMNQTTSKPVAQVCVYPVIMGTMPSDSAMSASGTYTISQIMSGKCVDSSGKFTLTLPPTPVTGVPAARFAIESSTAAVTGGLFPPAPIGSQNYNVQSANTYPAGTATNSDQSALVNPLVAVYDSTAVDQPPIGLTLGDQLGLWDLGVRIVVPIKGQAFVLGQAGRILKGQTVTAEGTNLSQDLINATGSNVVLLQTSTKSTPMQTAPLPNYATVQGKVLIDGKNPQPYQLVQLTCRAGCKTNMVAETNESGVFRFDVPVNASVTIGYGSSLWSGYATTGVTTLPPARTIPSGRALLLPNRSPITYLTPSKIALAQGVEWTWSGASLEAAPYAFKRAVATATYRTALGKYSAFVTDNRQRRNVTLTPGSTECDKVYTIVAGGTATAASDGEQVVSCQTVPLDDRALSPSGGWKFVTNRSAYTGTLSKATQAGARLTLAGVTGHRLALVWARAPHAGRVSVAVNGRVIATLSTAGKAANKLVTQLPPFTMKNAKVTITAVSASASAPVAIDGLAILP